MADPVRIMLEQGKKKRVVACAFDWPGWDRSAKTEDDALRVLTVYRPRYALSYNFLPTALFVRPGYGNYFYGDYFGPRYARAGYTPFVDYRIGRYAPDPLYGYYTMGNAFGIPALAVDTHVFRVSQRLGLARSDDAEKIHDQLCQVLPRPRWTQASHLLILHGRRVCAARKPACPTCPILALCPWPGKTKAAPAKPGARRRGAG